VARGRTLAELFANAARAMCDYGGETARVRPRETIRMHARAATLEDLLFSWLSEILFLTDAERWVFGVFEVSSIEQPFDYAQGKQPSGEAKLWEIEAFGRGERFDKARHRARTYIKAVTYHQLAVRETRDGWQATVYLDV
jgi:SHS2 domain-containing protein